jgi:DNA helicase-2/ATP-dependent DNA helicase PcrA|tara:strand:- start:23766 stop:25226 length:1461 start_codon:yes stop_codon:yes gene_type:complete
LRRVQIILGPPGTGKTTTLLNIVEDAISRGIKPERIAYLAFTRKAASEAQERAMAQFNLDENRFPYFRTLHSLAFKQLSLQRDEVMTSNHYRKFGKAMGINFKGIYDEVLGFSLGDGVGDKCSRIESLARMGLRTMEQQYELENISDLNLHAVKQYHNSLLKYKKDNGVLDFTDMLQKYDSELDIDICIIDEAQDLSSIQYKMAIKVASLAQEIYIAGDDDQAIFGWAGADVSKFLNLKGDRMVLPQSFRIPRSVHKLAADVVRRIKNRYPKPWQPRSENGFVDYVVDEQQIDFNREGSWMLLARSKYLTNRLKRAVRQQGFAYSINNKSSLESDETRAIISWENLRKGSSINLHDAKNIVQFLGISVNLRELETYTIESLGLPEASKQFDWMQMLKGIAPDEREYLRSCLRNGEKISEKPRITISTIHQSKGGEADNLVLLTDLNTKSWENLGNDEENRVWYVALTRAKENLFIVRPRTLKSFNI